MFAAFISVLAMRSASHVFRSLNFWVMCFATPRLFVPSVSLLVSIFCMSLSILSAVFWLTVIAWFRRYCFTGLFSLTTYGFLRMGSSIVCALVLNHVIGSSVKLICCFCPNLLRFCNWISSSVWLRAFFSTSSKCLYSSFWYFSLKS